MHIGSEPSQNSAIEAWVRARLHAPGVAEPLQSSLSGLLELIERERGREHDFFLSVVLRTQATRWEQLQDSLLSLAGQTDHDFEVLLILHDVPTEIESKVRELVVTYPDSFANRVQVCPVKGGGRARPLSAGVDAAKGEYIAFFDDDDLLMAHWVETFRAAAATSTGKVIRANVAVQKNRPEQWRNGGAGQRSISVAAPEYAKHFNLLEHLESNRTPFMGFAFPRAFFAFWGERFDESLPVLEDWDIILRAAGLIGVTSSSELTAIYRHWEGSRTSYTEHDKLEWDETTERVRSRINNAPVLIGENALEHLLEMIDRDQRIKEELLSSTSWRVTRPLRIFTTFLRKVRSRLR